MDSPLTFISLFEDDDSRWQAVVSRNGNADGFFVYAVKTTKIFCRPICKARLARRANVSFYATGVDAQLAGFRACKRCKPELAGFMPEETAVQKIRGFVRDKASGGAGDNSEMRLSLSQMAKQTGLSKWHFHRVFKKCVGVTPTIYLREQRMRKTMADQTEAWPNSLDIENLDTGCEFGLWHGVIPDLGQSSTDPSSGAASECSPWSFDDLVSWPDA